MIPETPARDPSRDTLGRTLVWAAVAWVAGAVVLLLAGQWLAEVLWVVALFIDVGYFALGVLMLLWSGVLALRRRARQPAIAAAVLAVGLCSAITMGGYVSRTGAQWLKRRRFEDNLARYEQAVAMVRQGGLKPGLHRSGVDFVVDSGPPVRVAFPWPGGILDNWQGIVYDPTGQVLKASAYQLTDESTRDDPEVSAMVSLFGGDMYYCEVVRRPWYFCLFT